jgi:hypothetical protein
LLILCDGGGSNSATHYLFKEDLQRLADRLGVELRVTVNRMSVRKLAVDGAVHDVDPGAVPGLPEEFHEIVEFGILASQRDPFDPMEKAFRDLGIARLARTEHLHADWKLERGYPLPSNLLAMSHVWKSPTGQEFVLAAKGAPEAVADLCHLNAERTRAVDEQVGGDGRGRSACAGGRQGRVPATEVTGRLVS